MLHTISQGPGGQDQVADGAGIAFQSAPAFQHRVANNKNQLDLGCCVFRFEKGPR
jgi:hypothetical protein